MTNIDADLTARIKDANNIHDVIGSYLTLRRAGVNYKGCCPFHTEDTASFVVSPSKGIFKCFGCGKSGDVIKFVQEHDQISFPEAVKVLAKRAGIEVKEVEMTDDQRRNALEREGLFITNGNAWNTYRQNLIQNHEALAYALKRGYGQEIINSFGIGYAENKNQLISLFKGNQIDFARKLALIKKGDRGEYDAFRNRLMFAFQDMNGNVIGFAGRHLDWKKGDPFGKWINSDDSSVFHKDRAVFGLYQSKASIVKYDRAYIVEGQGDVVSMHQCGLTNTVAGSGTAFSAMQARQILRFTKNITLIYDGDEAGRKAMISTAEVLLGEGANVRFVALPEGEDPDSYFPKQENEKLRVLIGNAEKSLPEYLAFRFADEAAKDAYRKEEILNLAGRMISLIHYDNVKAEFTKQISKSFDVSREIFTQKTKAEKPRPDTESWKDGFHGIEEARAIATRNEVVTLTFEKEYFLDRYDSKPVIYAKGNIEKHNIQYLQSKVHRLRIENGDVENIKPGDKGEESDELLTLKSLFANNVEIEIEECTDSETKEYQTLGFVDFYVGSYGEMITIQNPTESVKAKYVKRCAEVIANAETSVRIIMMKEYAKKLKIAQTDLKAIVTPYVNLNKDKATIESQNLNDEKSLIEFDPERLPNYVNEDEEMQRIYQLDHYYPILKKTDNGPQPVGYMFQNEKGGGHKCVSDFFMVPLLHIDHNDSALNKRVIQLNHRHFEPRFVEWQSSFMANLGKLNEKFIEVGAYNFDGSMNQYKAIWRNMSYKFTKCVELRTFGQQPEEFWAFTNAIFHEVKGELKMEYTNHLGVVQHNGRNYYSPAFSEIFAHQRHDDDQYELDRYFIYKKSPENLQLNFEKWAAMMNNVYWINDNGKWAVLFTMLACFRDFIFQNVHRFTTLFFIGPTGSGKSQVAESMRSLFMNPNAPKFNLNNGTDAAFFMLLERNKNVLAIMEEYNDTSISVLKFQGLKAAVLDGQGRQKIKDAASKTMDSSKINAVPLPLGQEAPQQDDGSLSNRVILCDVPYNPQGAFTEEEKERFRTLKMHEEAGLCEVLLEVLALRKLVKEHYILIYTEEIKKIQDSIRTEVSNDEGLGRVIESIAMVTAMCRFVEDKTELELPFTYKEFFKLGCDKVLKQMETISSSNKLQTYFSTISFLINQESLKIGKELKVSEPGRVTVLRRGKSTESVDLEPKEMKVLYLDFEAIYPLYARSSTKDALSRASLRAYFESNKAYIGLCKATNFIWYDQRAVPKKDVDGNITDIVEHVMEKKKNCTSAYMFNYDVLKELMNVDYERQEEETITSPGEYAPPKEELPF